jgi:hypothetical protein
MAAAEHLWVIVPFGLQTNAPQRMAQLDVFRSETLPIIRRSTSARVHVIVAEQWRGSPLKFNRGMCCNVGFMTATELGLDAEATDTRVIFHDVDLVPSARALPFYSCNPEGPVAIGQGWKRYDSRAFTGAVFSIRPRHYVVTGGYTNRMWGWGGEDNNFGRRLGDAGERDWLRPRKHPDFFEDLEKTRPTTRPAARNGIRIGSGGHPDGFNVMKYEVLRDLDTKDRCVFEGTPWTIKSCEPLEHEEDFWHVCFEPDPPAAHLPEAAYARIGGPVPEWALRALKRTKRTK